MFAVFPPSTDFLLKSTTTLSKIILRVHEKPNLNNHRPQRIGLPGQRRTPTPLMEPVPRLRGIQKIADSQRESTENSHEVLYFMVCRSSSPTLCDDRRDGLPHKHPEETDKFMHSFTSLRLLRSVECFLIRLMYNRGRQSGRQC